MRPKTAARTAGPLVLILSAAVSLVAGCGRIAPAAPGGPRPAAPPSRPGPAPSASLDSCLPATTRTLVVPAGAKAITVALLGSGGTTVVLSDQSDESLCAWLPFAATLTKAGYRVAVWDYVVDGDYPPQQVAAVTAAVRGAGATGVVLVGASEGAKASLIAATTIEPRVDGVVSLSAEAVLRPGFVVATAVAGLRCPSLLFTAARDPFGSTSAAPQIMAAIPDGDKKLITVPGSGHGTDLLHGTAAGTVVPAITAFIRRVTAG